MDAFRGFLVTILNFRSPYLRLVMPPVTFLAAISRHGSFCDKLTVTKLTAAYHTYISTHNLTYFK